MRRVVHIFEDIRTQSLVRMSLEREARWENNPLTCEVWITVRSFIRENPASILPRRPMLMVSDHTSLQVKG